IQERAVSVLPAFAARPAPARVRTKPAAVIATAPVAAPAPPPAPAAAASVTLGIAPWGEIIVDGDPHGVSPPLTRLTLAPGTHTIEVRNSAAPPYIARLDLQPGQAVEVRHRF